MTPAGDACARASAVFKVFSPAVARRLGIADEASLRWFESFFQTALGMAPRPPTPKVSGPAATEITTVAVGSRKNRIRTIDGDFEDAYGRYPDLRKMPVLG